MHSEAEIQVLIALIELSEPVETPNNNHYTFYPKTLSEAATYFKSLKADWNLAYAALAQKGLIQPCLDGWQLTPPGRQAAAQLRQERPPIYYWYEEFYDQAPRSLAYSEFCTRLYGRDICQAGFSDMEQIDALVAGAALKPGQKALELGCGAGQMAEYISDLSGASVLGIDYSPAAIRCALERTAGKRSHLDYRVANMDSLEFAPESSDVIFSIDTLYMPTNLEVTLRRIKEFLAPGGLLLAFYTQMIWDVAGGDRQGLLADNTPLGVALRHLRLEFTVQDFTPQTYALMQRKHKLGVEMRPIFDAEGSLALNDFIMAESEANPQRFDPQTVNFMRYLYRVVKKG
jgi:ubiquinone/menaquinone biosynthesis C-methylase UbiE